MEDRGHSTWTDESGFLDESPDILPHPVEYADWLWHEDDEEQEQRKEDALQHLGLALPKCTS
eukprot:1161205-Pelagomonas_calceolata.AAC.6